MNLAEIIDEATEDGVKLILSPSGKVVVAGAKHVVKHWRPLLAEHKAELLAFLGEQVLPQPRQECDFEKADSDNPERVSQKVRGAEAEILVERQGVQKVGGSESANEAGNTTIRQVCKGKASQLSEQFASQDKISPAIPAKEKNKPSPHALKWLRDHKVVLRLAGWTAPELYRRNKSRGLAWTALWDRESLKVTVDDDGVIVFRFKSASDRTITQTARPMKRKSWRQHGTAN